MFILLSIKLAATGPSVIILDTFPVAMFIYNTYIIRLDLYES